MFKRLGGFFAGAVRFRVESKDFRILNRLRGLKLSDVTIDDEVFEFSVPLRNGNRARQFLRNQKFTETANFNILGVLNVFYSRIAFSVALTVCLIALIISGNFIFRIKVLGVEGERLTEIAQFIGQNPDSSIKPFTLKSSANAQKTATDIIARFDYVAHASSKIVGNVLYFQIFAVNMPGDTDENKDIIATNDGVITQIIVASGTAAVKPGDIVRKGDVLIMAKYKTGVDLDGAPVYESTRAVGEVRADVSYSEFGFHTSLDELLNKIILRTGITNFDKVETFMPIKDVLEVVATINVSIV